MIQFNEIILRPEYQEPAHIATLEALKDSNYKGPIIIDASVGAGKTILIGGQCKYWTDKNANVLALARKGELVEQDSQDAWIMGCKTSIFSASLKSKNTAFKCVMGTELTVSNHLHSAFSEKGFIPHLLLIDECHEVNFQEIEEWIRAQEKGEDFECKTSYARIITHFLKIRPKLRIIGYTGSPYRGRIDIMNKFWKKKIYEISTMQLTSMGYLVPPIFGFPDLDHKYELDEFEVEGGPGAHDFSSKELVAMQRKITKDKCKTEIIIEEVITRTSDRNGVLITCSGKKHCEQVAELLPDGAWGIITDDTSTAKRRKILKDAKEGKVKFVLQVGCLTTGIDVSYWDTNVLMRKIGSITLLTQLLGRTARLLKPFLAEQGIVKDDHLILDYAGVFESMGDIYNDPMLDKALAKFAEDVNAPKTCPECKTKNEPHAVHCITEDCEHYFKKVCEKCGTVNSQYAVRCISEDKESKDGRCEHFFNSVLCLACDTENAPTAQSCRNCDAILIDPNKNLVHKAYTDDDYKPVKKVEFSKTKKEDGICVTYFLDSMYHDQGIQKPEIAREYFQPFSKETHLKAVWQKFVRHHVNGCRFQQSVYKNATIDALLRNSAVFDKPTHITHRVNDKGFSIISRKKFLSGRVAK